MNSRSPDPLARAAGLSIWSAPVEPEPITGGITNTNFAVRDGGRRYFVRIGEDIAEAFVLEQYFGAEPDAGLWRRLPGHEGGLGVARSHVEHGFGAPFDARFRL